MSTTRVSSNKALPFALTGSVLFTAAIWLLDARTVGGPHIYPWQLASPTSWARYTAWDGHVVGNRPIAGRAAHSILDFGWRSRHHFNSFGGDLVVRAHMAGPQTCGLITGNLQRFRQFHAQQFGGRESHGIKMLQLVSVVRRSDVSPRPPARAEIFRARS